MNPFEYVLQDVPRYSVNRYGEEYLIADGEYFMRDDVLAALAAAVPADLAEAGKVLEGVTEGPWRVDGEPWNQIVWSGADNRVCFMAHSNGLDDTRDVATARFIAWCREGVPALLARIAAQEAQIKGLEKGRDRRTEMHECAMSERDDATLYADEQKARAEAAETTLAAMTKERDEALHFLDVSIAKSPEPLKALGSYLADLLDEDDWPTADRLLNGAVAALAAERAKVAEIRLSFENVDSQVSDEGEFTERAWEQLRAAIMEAGHE